MGRASNRKKHARPQHPKGAPAAVMSRKVAARSTVAMMALDDIGPLPTKRELQGIQRALAARERSEVKLGAAVRAAHAAGHTWRVIGKVLGMSAQGAHKRFVSSPEE